MLTLLTVLEATLSKSFESIIWKKQYVQEKIECTRVYICSKTQSWDMSHIKMDKISLIQ